VKFAFPRSVHYRAQALGETMYADDSTENAAARSGGTPVHKRILDLFEAESIKTLYGIPDPNFMHLFLEAEKRASRNRRLHLPLWLLGSLGCRRGRERFHHDVGHRTWRAEPLRPLPRTSRSTPSSTLGTPKARNRRAAQDLSLKQ
jgi:hypothetical protein